MNTCKQALTTPSPRNLKAIRLTYMPWSTCLLGYFKKYPALKLHPAHLELGSALGSRELQPGPPGATTGIVTHFKGTPISWKSKRQPSSMLSTSEA